MNRKVKLKKKNQVDLLKQVIGTQPDSSQEMVNNFISNIVFKTTLSQIILKGCYFRKTCFETQRHAFNCKILLSKL